MASIKIERAGDYLTLEGACKELEIPHSTLEYLLRRDAIQTYKLGYCRLMKITDVEKLLQSRKEVNQK